MKIKKIFLFLIALLFFGQKIHALKILFFDHTFPALTQTFVLNQITGMIDRGHDITILALGQDKQAFENERMHSDIYDYNLLNKVYYNHLPSDKRNFDLILCEFGHLGNIFLKMRDEWGVTGKILTFFRGRDLNALGSQRYYHKLFNKGDYFLPVCHFFRRKLIRLGCKEEKIFVLHSAIDVEKFPYQEKKIPKNGNVKIVTTSRLVPKKGTEYAIKAVARLLRMYPHIQYTIIGGGPLQKRLQKIIDTYHAEKNIHLVGWKSQEEVAQLLKESHIFILPSVTASDGDKEGIPNALKEAMALGLPVISTYHSGIPELVINRKNGFLVPEKNVTHLMSRLEFLITHPQVWSKMGKLGRKMIENEFEKERLNDKLHKLCLQFASSKRIWPNPFNDAPQVDMLLFSEENPLLLSEYLDAAFKKISNFNICYVFYKSSIPVNVNNYENLKKKYDNNKVKFIQYTNDLTTLLSDTLHLSTANYLFISTAQHSVFNTISLSQAARDLMKEDAYAVYFSCSKNDAEVCKVDFQCVGQKVYKWKLSQNKGRWKHPHNMQGSLYKKYTFLNAINKEIKSLDELKILWSQNKIDQESWGLFYNTASISVR